ncbi:MAG TPA: flagellar export chaperone FliS [Burkholderiaceae bacterium]
MYGSPSPFAPRGARANQAYSRVGLETDVHAASPHRLVSMLMDGLFDAMQQALVAMAAGQIEAKGRALTRAVRIVEEGLKAALNLEAGPLATDLRDLYAYITLRLTRANLDNDPSAIAECQRLMEPIREAWKAIAPTESRQQAA